MAALTYDRHESVMTCDVTRGVYIYLSRKYLRKILLFRPWNDFAENFIGSLSPITIDLLSFVLQIRSVSEDYIRQRKFKTITIWVSRRQLHDRHSGAVLRRSRGAHAPVSLVAPLHI